jgi:beta-lactamase superfamily II metal-dependent hydrolase
MELHFINVGCGNMTLFLFPDGTTWLYDCNITNENEFQVIGYLKRAMGTRLAIRGFVCSHRDADHMRGIRRIHNAIPIGGIWDNGVPGTTTNSAEYLDYMNLRRQLENGEIVEGRTTKIGEVEVLWMNSKDSTLSDTNDQSLVAKISYRGNSCLLAGDTSYLPWKRKLVRRYGNRLKANLLLAAHHGSITFFDDPTDTQNYYLSHIAAIAPEMTLISVGPNAHGLPDKNAIEFYSLYSIGSNERHKIATTEAQGNMRLILGTQNGWALWYNQ